MDYLLNNKLPMQVLVLLGALFLLASTEDTEFVDLGQARASMSSEYQNPNNHRTFLAHYAIDGNETTKPDQCFCCAGASRSPSSWMLDLRKHYLVQGLIFIGRDDGFSYQSRKFTVYKGFSNTSETRWLLYNNTASDGYKFKYNFSSPTLMQHLEIRSPGILTICELKLIRAVCIDGMFGDDCQSPCQCYQGATCHAVTGECPNHKCALGRKGFNCSQVCDYATFGDGCLFSCHCYQADNCNAVTGECPNQKCAPGWKGLNCSLVCDPGTFGDGCNSHCNCYHNAVCNTTTGECPDQKCAAGWKDLNCSLACDAKTFGEGCRFPCHCNNSVQCDRMSGSCPLNRCDVEWSGNNCSIDANLIRRIGHQVHVTSSQPHFETWAADKAIDFIESSNPESCDCCSGSKGRPAWFRIDLGATYPINTIIFIGRKDGPSYQSRNFSMYDGFREVNQERMLIYKNNATSGHKFVISFHQPLILQYVEIYSVTELTICEIKFIESERCPPGYFGRHCTERCFCNDRLSCNRLTGACQHPGCLPGWQGVSCNKSCDFGFFGDDCGSQCHCFNNVSCPSVSGNCSNEACAPGWQGLPTCSKECDWGSFGNFCAQNCHCYQNVSCYNVNGYCPNGKCAPGWKTHSCSKVCDWGSFGYECSNHCHCYENASCENVNGTCSNGECAAGWRGLSCSDACGSRTFGDKCSAQCHCFHDQECEHINGICPSGMCASGWQYDNCSEACDAGKFGGSCMSECHCLGGHPCHHIDGSCMPELCAPGWWGYNCSIACVNNTYGQNCNSSCHCDTCNHINGSCDKRTCYSQWTGINCNVPAEPLTQDEPDSSPAVIIGPVVAVVVLVAVAAAFLFYKRHTSNKPDKATTNLSDLHESQATTTLNKTEPSVVKHKNKKPVQASQEATSTPDEHVYYSFCTTTNTIHIQDLWDYLNQKSQDKFVKMHLEFKKLPSGLVHDCLEASRPENARKNRYKGMIAYDHSRVVLHRVEPSATTYINACYINGFSRPKKFIAAQGPQGSTVDDFWEMVVQQNASLIVMLTNVIEIGTRKCVQYWPSEEDEELQYSDINITTAKISTFPDSIIRELDVSKAGDRPHRITQVHFTAWPDKDVPDAAWHLVNVWRKVNSLNGNKTDPIVVHCSAGVGRSGTYIALDILHEQAKAEGCIQPLHIVTNMRQQRVNMVQTKDQYVFLHEAVAESLHLGVKPIKTRDFEAVYKSLLEKDSSTGEIGLEQQFLFLQQIKPVEEESEYYNVTLKESDEYRPKATSSTAAARPDLCRIQNYTGKETFIVSRAPTNSDDIPQNLLNVIRNRNIKTIVNLHIGKGNSDKIGYSTSMNETEESCIELLETKRQKNFLEKKYEIKRHNSPREGRELKQFVFLMWRDGTPAPSDTSTVIELLNAVQRWQPTTDEAQPILVVCEFGDERSGLVCALLSEFERIRIKEEVNLLETVKTMKQRNPQLIPNYVQYKYCHSAVLDYIRQSDVYMNV